MYIPMSSPNPRKRPAPGSSPVGPIQPMQQPYNQGSQADQMMRWNGAAANGNNFVDGTGANVNAYNLIGPQTQYGQGGVTAPSNALARRPMSQALVAAPRQAFSPTSDPWNLDDPNFLQQNGGIVDDHDNIELLEERAQHAKREAQAKRKQIPPFVQKLSSFLDESKNTELIRWSDKGDSFIVLDEDEFAKTLIPELFKHNNYASFVRQLNMYGFHKRVGLSDNSMKASERKNKSPSEYYNPYFKRGHPNLLWLINKPKSGTGKKKGKKEDGDPDSEEEAGVEETFTAPPPLGPQTNNLIGRAPPPAEVGTLQRKELVQVKTQIDMLQSQQKAISQMLDRLRRDHQQLYQQAIMFQNQHERHENSINAILNFLANVFRKSLEDGGGAQSVSDLLASIIPGAQASMPQGSVVDLGDLFNQQNANASASNPLLKRSQRLLPPPPGQGKASTVSPSPSTASTPGLYQQGPTGQVTELFDTSPSDTSSPNFIKQELQTNPHEGMMKIINDTNASKSSGLNLPDMAANTPATLSTDQRNKMLSAMAASSGMGPNSMFTTAGPSASTPPRKSPPVAANANTSLSPLMASAARPPSIQQLGQTQAELDYLQRLQEEQSAKLTELQSLLGPLSPSGRIPGIEESAVPTSYFDDNIDINQFLDTNAFNDPNNGYNTADFGPDANAGVNLDGSDFNFSLDGTGDFANGQMGGAGGGGAGQFETGRVFETASDNNTPSPAATEEVFRNDLDSPERNSKRQRRG